MYPRTTSSVPFSLDLLFWLTESCLSHKRYINERINRTLKIVQTNNLSLVLKFVREKKLRSKHMSGPFDVRQIDNRPDFVS